MAYILQSILDFTYYTFIYSLAAFNLINFIIKFAKRKNLIFPSMGMLLSGMILILNHLAEIGIF